jgi:diguanylate cyclase (GGDEF)-like protein/PAS domain S-box-containing protein
LVDTPGPVGTAAAGGDYESLLASSADLIVVTSACGVYRYVSPACPRLFGWDPSELIGRSQDDFVHPDDLSALHAALNESAGGQSATVTFRFLSQPGSYHWVEATCRQDLERCEPLTITTMRDIAERKETLVTLQRQALTDPLTGVANRTVLMDRLNHALRRQGRGSGVVAVMYVDLDRFKVVNDSLGHRIGDTVLMQMAERLLHYMRPADTLARLGGDEFVIVAEDVENEQAAIEMGKRITEVGRRPFVVGDEEFVCTISIGITCTADSQYAAEDLLQEADLALYRAKDRGRDRSEIFDEDLRTKAIGRMSVERMLRQAIDDDRLVVEYQPIVDLSDVTVIGAEALVRVRDDAGELHLPASFIEVAEESGLLTDIDAWVLDAAIQQADIWRNERGAASRFEVALNITARHLADAGFATTVIEKLDMRGIPRASLQIEVTERVLMSASNSAMTGWRALRAAGVRVGLDDFGTGYSSLAYLRQFPLDFVKIDKSLIDGMVRTNSEKAIVAAVIELAHALGLVVVAEGIERESQLDLLQSLRCDRGQGFLFAPPGPPAPNYDLTAAGSLTKPR